MNHNIYEGDLSQKKYKLPYEGMLVHEFLAILQEMQNDIDNQAPNIINILASMPNFIEWVKEKLAMALIIQATEPLSTLEIENSNGLIHYGWIIPTVKELKFNQKK